MDVRTYALRADDFLRTKISWMHRFLTHGAPLHALRARESSANNEDDDDDDDKNKKNNKQKIIENLV